MKWTAESFAGGIALAAILSFCSLPARAHAPLPKAVVTTRDGVSLALSIPGFGLLMRAQESQPFVYACDALLGQKPSLRAPSMAFVANGDLVLASESGLRTIDAQGCPRSELKHALSQADVVLTAVAQSELNTVYAVVGGPASALWHSTDGGQQWQQRALLSPSEPVNGLVVSGENAETLYLSVASGATHKLLASYDGGATFTTHVQDAALTLLSADGRAPFPLWAWARDAESVGNRGFAILRANGPAGQWQKVLQINYLGGFVIDARGVITVGDEIGGLYTSDNDGDSFFNREPATDVACLAHGGDALWACTPGSEQQPALQALRGDSPLTSVVTFEEVQQLPSCPSHDVTQLCAAAWVEWQRDVLRRELGAPDASVPATDAGLEGDAASRDVAEKEGGSAARRGDGCSVRALAGEHRGPPLWLLVVLAWLIGNVRGRRTRCLAQRS